MTPIRRISGAAAILLVAALPSAASAQDKPKQGGQLLFAISQGEPATFDCHAAASINVMMRVSPHYSTLLQIDPASYPKVEGDLAQSWTVSPDSLTYTFKLNKAKFHDGSDVTATDVKVSLDRMRNPPPGVVSVRKAMLSNVSAVEAPDDQTVIVRVAKPSPLTLQLLAMPFACIYSAKMLASDPDYPAKKVMGSGPFKFVSYTPGVEWVGERNGDYFKKGSPNLDGFKALSLSPSATVNALAAGQVMIDFRGVSEAEASRIVSQRGDKVEVFKAEPAIALPFIAVLNNQKPALQDVRVRKAIALALDHWNGSKVIARSSTLSAVGGLVRPGSEYARSDEELKSLPGYGTDVEAARNEARKLLKDAGQTDLKLTFLNRKPWPFFGIFLVDQLGQIGITVTHEQAEDPQFFARRAAGDFDIILDALPDVMDDPVVQWAPFRSFKNNPGNVARFDDADFDKMYDDIATTVEPAKRKEIIRKAETYLIGEKAYIVPLFWGRRTTVVSKELGGYVAAPTNYIGLDLQRYWIR